MSTIISTQKDDREYFGSVIRFIRTKKVVLKNKAKSILLQHSSSVVGLQPDKMITGTIGEPMKVSLKRLPALLTALLEAFCVSALSHITLA